MLRDRGPKYSIGFGISSSQVPIQSDPYGQIGASPNPQGGYIANALHGHPVLRFVAVGAAMAAVMEVGTQMLRGGGVRLADHLGTGKVTGRWGQSLLHDFRGLQKSLDEWEAVGHVYEGEGDARHITQTFKKAGFWLSEGDKARMAERAARGDYVQDVAEWTLRNEMQQQLVHQARALPYSLPAMYVAGKVSRHITGDTKPGEKKVKWYNPVDVIGDFALQSSRNVLEMMLPGEVGRVGGTHAWHKLLTYGDHVASTSTFAGTLRSGTSLGLQSVLERFGHRASTLIAETTKRSSQVAGSFGTAINEAVENSKRPMGFMGINRLRAAREGLVGAGTHGDKMRAIFEGMSPRSMTFARSLHEDWFKREGADLNKEALRNGATSYMLHGRSIPVNHAGIVSGNEGSNLEQFASFIQRYAPNPDSKRLTGEYARKRQRDMYMRMLENNIGGEPKLGDFSTIEEFKAARKNYREAVEQVVTSLQLKNVPTSSEPASVAKTMASGLVRQGKLPKDLKYLRGVAASRLRFGKIDITDMAGDPWEAQMGVRLGAVELPGWPRQRINPAHARTIGNNLIEAVRKTDEAFTLPSFRKQMDADIRRDWEDAYRRVLVPEARKIAAEGKLPYELLDVRNASRNMESMVRRLAMDMGMDVRGVSTSKLRAALSDAGMDIRDRHAVRAQLVDRGIMTKPWQKDAYNILGLRRLSVEDAVSRHFYPSDVEPTIDRLNREMADPYMRGLGHRVAGRGVYETRSGQIVDLSQVKTGLIRATDSLSKHVQVPLLHIKPFDLLSYSARRQMSQGPLVQMDTMLSRHSPATHFTRAGSLASEATGGARDVDSLFYMRTGKRGQGRLVGHRYGMPVVDAPGAYKSGPTGYGEGMLARAFRQVIGGHDTYVPGREGRGLENRARRFFRQADKQSGNIFAWPKMLREGRMAEWLPWRHGEAAQANVRDSAVFARNLLRDWEKTGEVIPSENITKDWVEGARLLQRDLRQGGVLRANVTKEITDLIDRGDLPPEMSESLNRILRLADPDTGDLRPLANIHQADEMYRIVGKEFESQAARAQEAMDEGTALPGLRREVSANQGFVRQVHLKNQSIPGYMNQRVGQHRRIDDFRADVIRELVANEDIWNQSDNRVISNLLSAIDRVKADHLIGGEEYTEARAAILSMQFDLANMRVRRGQPGLGDVERLRAVLGQVLGHEQASPLLHDAAQYHLRHVHTHRLFGLEGGIRRTLSRYFSARTPEFEGLEYSPYGGNQENVFVPTLGSAIGNVGPYRALKSVIGATTNSDPEAYSVAGTATQHMHYRMNRYFQMIGSGVDQLAYKGPIGFLGRGLVGKRVVPVVAGMAAFMAADRTLGHMVHGRDEYGNKRYDPLVTGTLATGLAHAEVALTPSPGARQRKREQLFGDREVAIRKGRYWPIGNQPWSGTKVMYYRPSWLQRFRSGYKYTPQTFGSPLEHLAYDYDFSPLRLPIIGDPYHWEKKHYKDRPYPVTGEYFTGQMGQYTSLANMVAGRFLKPTRFMHRQEMADAMINMQRVGEEGMAQPRSPIRAAPVITRLPTGGAALLAPQRTAAVLGREGGGRGGITPDSFRTPYDQPYGFIGMPYGTTPDQALASYRRPYGGVMMGGSKPRMSQLAAGNSISNAVLTNVNRSYEARAGIPARNKYDVPAMVYTGQRGRSYYGGNNPYDRVVMSPTHGFDPRMMAAANPINPGSLKYQASQAGYEAHEMFGIYGFGFGAVKQALGYGWHDWHPNEPVLQSAARAYGSERSFWDLNWGGMGDFPTPLEGEYGNIEFSEIARRFIPHRRRSINEVNPIPNTAGKQYPWLPGDNYFINFHQGDPYIQIPEGEMRLPGPGYELTHKLHPDVTGRYGLLDQHAILGDIAPWSDEYKSIDRVLRKANLSPQDKALVIGDRKQVASVNKRLSFSPYRYSNTDFQTKEAKVTGFAAGDADLLYTSQGPVRLAGVRARRNPRAEEFIHRQLKKGDDLRLTYDANYPNRRDEPLDAIVRSGHGASLNDLMAEEDWAYPSKKMSPLDRRQREGAFAFHRKALGERIGHLNTVFNTKFMPRRTAVEDWERYNVYGSNFPQWEHPYRDFFRPMTYRAMNRNPLLAAGVLAVVGGAFAPEGDNVGKVVGRSIGAIAGFGLAFHSDAKTVESGQRFIPRNRKQQLQIEENVDILNYIKYSRLYSAAREEAMRNEKTDPEEYAKKVEAGKFKEHQFTNIGPITAEAMQYRKQLQSTMYGADPFGDVVNLSAAIPKRKRDHFLEFLTAPVNERARILSTAPRLERRIYEARWKMPVEQRPNLEEYFSQHELPAPSWTGWDPRVNMDQVKLKMVNHQGLDASQMGYYPQQVQEANLTNLPYPDITKRTTPEAAAAQLRLLMAQKNINGNVMMRRSPQPGTRVSMNSGVY